MIKTLLSSLIILLIASISLGQQLNTSVYYFNNYTGLFSKGNIPPEFVGQRPPEIKELSSKSSESQKKNDKTHTVSAEYWQDILFKSGQILFNDTLSNYVKKVSEKALSANPQLSKEIHVFVVKSPRPNCITFNNGNIFINIGLLSYIESEAQLAFLICREAIHYKHKHVQENISEELELHLESGIYSATKDLETKLFSSNKYSNEIESLTDSLALAELFSKTPYSLNTLPKFLELYQKTNEPFVTDSLSNLLFNNKYRVFPSTYFSIANTIDNNSSLYTSPTKLQKQFTQLDYRKSKLEALISNYNVTDNGTLTSNLNEQEFFKTLARFECIRLQVIQANYSLALYLAEVYKKTYADSKFLNKIIAACLYGISKNKTRDDVEFQSADDTYETPSINSIQNFIKKLTPIQSTALALDFAFTEKLKNPDSYYFTKIVEDLLSDLTYKFRKDQTYFFTIESAKKAIKYTPGLSDSSQFKYSYRDPFSERFFLCESLLNVEFNKLFSSSKNKANSLIEEDERENERISKNYQEVEGLGYKYYYGFKRFVSKKESKRFKRVGYNLGIKNILLNQPEFYDISVTTGNIFSENTEAKRNNLKIVLNESLNKVGIKATILDPHYLTNQNVEEFNQMNYISEWQKEVENMPSFRIPYTYDQLYMACEKSGSFYLNQSVTVSYQNRQSISAQSVIVMILVPITIPFYILATQIYANNIYYLNSLYDIKDYKLLISTERLISGKINSWSFKKCLKKTYKNIYKKNP